MYRLLEYVPPIGAWLPGVVIVALVVAFNLFARYRGWTHPAAASFWLTTGLAITMITVWWVTTQRSTDSHRPEQSFLAGFIPVVIGTVTFAGAIAATLHSLGRRSVGIIIVGTTVTAVLAYPVAFLLMMYAACMTGLGCI